MIVLYGQPRTKKNHMRICINKKTGKPFVAQSQSYSQYEKDCLKQLMTCRERYSEPIQVVCKYWLKDNRIPDLLNLLAGTHDILEKSGVIDNDKNIVSVDGSRIVGVDKQNPRCEIEIKAV